MEERLKKLEEVVQTMQERNVRVEGDKAWETSVFRIAVIMFLTYVVAVVALSAIGNNNPLFNAFVPVLGFFLSTRSIRFLKKTWIEGYMQSKIK